MSNFVHKSLFFIADLTFIAVLLVTLYCYAFNVTDASGYSLDGIATVLIVISSLFGVAVNWTHRREFALNNH